MGLAEQDRLLTDWNIFIEQFPVIVLPNSPSPFLETELDTRGREGALATLDGIRFQFPCPVLGLPGISVPTGRFNGQPLGVQMISRRFREDLLLSAAEIIEALERIDKGVYGICAGSGQAIPKERLKAIPWATERVEYKVGGFGRL